MSGGEGKVTIRSGAAGERQEQQEAQILDYASGNDLLRVYA